MNCEGRDELKMERLGAFGPMFIVLSLVDAGTVLHVSRLSLVRQTFVLSKAEPPCERVALCRHPAEQSDASIRGTDYGLI